MSDPVILAIIATFGTVITSSLSAYVLVKTNRIEVKTKETHDLVNGMSHDLTAAQTGKDRAEAFTEGEAAQRSRETPNAS